MLYLMGIQAGTEELYITGPPADTGPTSYLTGTKLLNIDKLPVTYGFLTLERADTRHRPLVCHGDTNYPYVALKPQF